MTPEGDMAPPRSWWSRNWKWAAPVGCLGLFGSCGCITAIFLAVGFSAAKSSTPYEQALAAAKADSVVQATLGPPVESSWSSQTSIQVRDGQSVAEFSIPLHGSKADGVLHVEATKRGGEWTYQVFQVDMADKPPILLQDKASGTPPVEDVPSTHEEEDEDEVTDTPPPPPPPDSQAPNGEHKPDIRL